MIRLYDHFSHACIKTEDLNQDTEILPYRNYHQPELLKIHHSVDSFQYPVLMTRFDPVSKQVGKKCSGLQARCLASNHVRPDVHSQSKGTMKNDSRQ